MENALYAEVNRHSPFGEEMKIYIAGPITGLPEGNKPAFDLAAAQLRLAGNEVVNPWELEPQQGLPWAHYMKVCIRALVDCDKVYFLPNWQNSKGACLEHKIAWALGLELTYAAVEQ